jgi:hypothetical protein
MDALDWVEENCRRGVVLTAKWRHTPLAAFRFNGRSWGDRRRLASRRAELASRAAVVRFRFDHDTDAVYFKLRWG